MGFFLLEIIMKRRSFLKSIIALAAVPFVPLPKAAGLVLTNNVSPEKVIGRLGVPPCPWKFENIECTFSEGSSWGDDKTLETCKLKFENIRADYPDAASWGADTAVSTASVKVFPSGMLIL